MSKTALDQTLTIDTVPAIPVSTVRDYFTLLKPGVMTLVVFTGAVGLLIAPGHIHPFLALVAIACIAVASGAAASINMWYDRDIDQHMKRTMNRPIPAGRVPADEALSLGILLSIVSVTVMAVAINLAAAALLAVSIGFYVFVYTMWLKRRTPQNIVIGGAAGAFPPMIGWAAVTGGIDLNSMALFMIIFMWTPPHFWALALFRCGDYAKVGVPMMPVVAGDLATKKQMLFYTILLLPVTLVPYFTGLLGLFYAATAAMTGLWFLRHAWRVLRNAEEKAPQKMFGYSILYLFVLFGAMVADIWLEGFIT
ncbi:protoheme IX farnesyltransferase [Thalassospira profundimaris]|uniref:Protoheme IX farnesyltransferase n=1 Tax=Thalassospira profundimaris TaxID=502049 RepID=A0A367X0T6_9PROT|nr:heme o synthase [Thalassospira profundimaris]RCK47099.1 protoheme IX farnesyltransferase [Thalassospira profundimaris]